MLHGADLGNCQWDSGSRQMVVMTTTPARDGFFIFCPFMPAVASEAGSGSPPVRQIGAESGTSWLVVRRPLAVQYGASIGTSILHRTAKRSNRGFPARTISSAGQRHFQRIGRPSAGASSKGLEPGRGWHCRSHHKGPASCPRFRGNFPRLRFRQPTYRNDCNKKTVPPSRSAFPF